MSPASITTTTPAAEAVTGTAAPASISKHFRCQNATDPRAKLSQQLRDTEFALYSPYFEVHCQDFDLEVEELAAITDRPKHEVSAAIFAYNRLRTLPKLRALQTETRLLAVHTLVGIDTALMKVGADVDDEVWDVFDAMLVELFTPKKANQPLPSRATIARRIRNLIAKLDVGLNYDPVKRKKREDAHNNRARSLEFSAYDRNGVELSTMELSTDNTTMAVLRASLKATAREHKLSMVDAAIKLLSGDIEPTAKVHLHVYAPAGEDGTRMPGTSVFIPGVGWTNSLDTAEFEDLCEANPPTVSNLDEAATSVTESYTPTQEMTHYAHARDGHCIFPGCSMPATKCQLDHRIPFDRGGKTTPHNLFCLCAHHHNMKTDKRAFYVSDPVTGEIVWLLENGTYLLSRHEGPLFDEITPTTPRWRSSLESAAANRDKVAEFTARIHRVLDDYDKHGDFYSCMADIQVLERRFDLETDLAPEPPVEEPAYIPTEPDPDPYPDAEPLAEHNPFKPGYVSTPRLRVKRRVKLETTLVYSTKAWDATGCKRT